MVARIETPPPVRTFFSFYSERKGVAVQGDQRPGPRKTSGLPRGRPACPAPPAAWLPGGVTGPRDHRFPAVDLVVLVAREEVRRLGGIQLPELRHGAAEPDLASGGTGNPSVDKAERDKLAQSLPMRWLDHEVGDRVIAGVDDQGS